MWAEYDNNLTPTGAIWFEALTPSVGIRSSSSQLVPTEQGY